MGLGGATAVGLEAGGAAGDFGGDGESAAELVTALLLGG